MPLTDGTLQKKNKNKAKQSIVQVAESVPWISTVAVNGWTDRWILPEREKGGWALHVLEFTENTVLSTSWLKRRPLPPRAACLGVSQCTFLETVAAVVQRGKQLSSVLRFRIGQDGSACGICSLACLSR